MALRVVEKAGLSDVGRQRDANEDSYVLAEPLFAVADGMGGAQAGEVASGTAAEVFEGSTDEGGTPEERLTSLTREANPHPRALAAGLHAPRDGHDPDRGHAHRRRGERGPRG